MLYMQKIHITINRENRGTPMAGFSDMYNISLC